MRNTPLYPSAVIVKINGEVYKLKSNKVQEVELPAGDYKLLACNEYEMFEGSAELTVGDGEALTVEVGLKNARAYQLFLVLLLVVAFIFVFFTQVSSLVVGLSLFAILAVYWAVEYYNRKSYFTFKVS